VHGDFLLNGCYAQRWCRSDFFETEVRICIKFTRDPLCVIFFFFFFFFKEDEDIKMRKYYDILYMKSSTQQDPLLASVASVIGPFNMSSTLFPKAIRTCAKRVAWCYRRVWWVERNWLARIHLATRTSRTLPDVCLSKPICFQIVENCYKLFVPSFTNRRMRGTRSNHTASIILLRDSSRESHKIIQRRGAENRKDQILTIARGWARLSFKLAEKNSVYTVLARSREK